MHLDQIRGEQFIKMDNTQLLSNSTSHPKAVLGMSWGNVVDTGRDPDSRFDPWLCSVPELAGVFLPQLTLA